MRLMKRWLSGLLCLVLLLGLLPTAALAEGEPASWADPAVKVLNEIYGSNIFSASDETMDADDAQTVLNNMGRSDLTAPNPFNRAAACEVLAEVFVLPVGEEDNAAITYLYKQNIVNGKSENDLGAEEPVSYAEFAVLTYRVLNFVGGGMGSKDGWPEPGSEGYTAWMYLAVRKCVPFDMSQAGTFIKDVNNFKTYASVSEQPKQMRPQIDGGETAVYDVVTKEASNEAIWNAWDAALQEPKLGGDEGFIAPEYKPDETLLDAAIRMVEAFSTHMQHGEPVIFRDVTAGNWFYDGIMYLANNDIVIGYGDGQFGPDDITPRYELAVLLATVDGAVLSTESGVGRIIDAIQHVTVTKDYMTGDVPTTSEENTWIPSNDDYWGKPATREETAVGILKLIASKEGITTTSDNLAILDRFTDADDIDNPDSKSYLAYAVSMGLLSGTSANTLSPTEPVSRAQTGVLLYRTLIGLDKTKMKDYGDSVNYAKGEESAQTFTLLAADPAPAAVETKTLTLREDWRLTSDLDLAVPEHTKLIIQGNGFHIYEMPGQLTNSGAGSVVFEDVILYPAGTSQYAATPEGSTQLMASRHEHQYVITVDNAISNGTVAVGNSATTAREGTTISLTATPNQGYKFSAWSVNDVYGDAISVSDDSFIMPASDVTVSATFVPVAANPAAPTFSPAGGTYSSAQSVEISCETVGAAIYYTTDDTEPLVTNGIRYTGPITISSTTTLKAIAVKDDISSAVASATYTINTGGSSIGGGSGGTSGVNGSGDNVSISPSGGSVTSSQMGSAVKKADEGSTITIKATSSTTVTLPVGGMAEAADNHNDIVVDLRSGEVVLSARAVASMTDGASASGRVEVVITSQTNSKDETISDLMDKGAAVFDVSVEVDGKSIHSFDGDLTISLTVSNLSKISDPHILHILTDSSKEYYAPDSISGNTITVKGIRNLSTFAVIPGSEVPKEPANPFTDVYESDYYYDAVLWAVENGVTNGTSATTFGPDMAVSRAQMVTFLWRAHGSPKATGTNPFTDVSTSDYYYDAVLWAVANGITNGTSTTTFSPDMAVTRAQAVTFQWRASGSPVVSGTSFDDVVADAYYANAVTWAVANGITNGTGGTTFSPDVVVSRAQAVTFLYRELA